MKVNWSAVRETDPSDKRLVGGSWTPGLQLEDCFEKPDRRDAKSRRTLLWLCVRCQAKSGAAAHLVRQNGIPTNRWNRPGRLLRRGLRRHMLSTAGASPDSRRARDFRSERRLPVA